MKHLEITKKKVKDVCLGCKDRKVGCHSNCEDYATWKAQLEEEKKKRKAENTFVGNENWSYTKTKI